MLSSIRAYKETDYEEVMTWLDKRGMDRIDKTVLSNTGFIIPGICCCFLYLNNSSVCFLENLFSNPEAEDREENIKFMVDTALKAAKDFKYKYVQAVTSNKRVIKYGTILGTKFEPNQVLMTLKL